MKRTLSSEDWRATIVNVVGLSICGAFVLVFLPAWMALRVAKPDEWSPMINVGSLVSAFTYSGFLNLRRSRPLLGVVGDVACGALMILCIGWWLSLQRWLPSWVAWLVVPGLSVGVLWNLVRQPDERGTPPP